MGSIRSAYGGVTLVYGAGGIASVVIALIFIGKCSTDNLINLLLGGAPLQVLMTAGLIALASAAVGLFGLVNTRNRGTTLHVYGWTILVVVILQLIVACVFWLETLALRATLDQNWLGALTAKDVSSFQEQFRCCGFANATDRAVATPLCPADASATTVKGCRDPVASKSQLTVQNFYTAIFAAIFIDFFAFLGCAIMAQYRQEEERFRKIDAKNLAEFGKMRI